MKRLIVLWSKSGVVGLGFLVVEAQKLTVSNQSFEETMEYIFLLVLCKNKIRAHQYFMIHDAAEKI